MESYENNLLAIHQKYRKLLHTKLLNRNERIVHRSLRNNIDQLHSDKNNLKAQVWVATAPIHNREHANHMKIIKCHTNCQENLLFENKKIKNQITILEKQILRVDKEIYDLNRRTIPDNQHIAHVAKSRKCLNILQNQLDVSIKRECTHSSKNALLREKIVKILNNRSLFNKQWRKLVNELNSGKKYLVDLVECAIVALEQTIQIYEKSNDLSKKEKRDHELRKIEFEEANRLRAQDEENHRFLTIKSQKREMADLEQREYKRREIFVKVHNKKIVFYNTVIKTFLDYSNSSSVDEVIDKFQQREGIYYSYFNYSNELSLQMTNLNNSIDELYNQIKFLKRYNSDKLNSQLESIADLTHNLKTEEFKTSFFANEKTSSDNELENMFLGLYSIFVEVNCDRTPILRLLGDHNKINKFNVVYFLKVLENQLNFIIAKVYINQKRSKAPKSKRLIRSVGKYLEKPTNLEDIVLAQQCPECAEGEDVNPYDAEYVEPLTVEFVKKKLQDKVKQPEMQYRLHSIDQCRLPRSRILANKR